MSIQLKAVQASFSYGKNTIFENINIEINQGEVLCLLGPNGTGKSTFLECLMGINRLTGGEILIQGENINRFPPQKIAQMIAYVPQLHQVSFPYEVLDIVLMGRAKDMKFYSAPTEADRAVAKEVLSIVGIEHFSSRIFSELSGGEKQLVMIARALAQQTPFIIMDEPTAHLDLNHEQQVLDTIIHLIKTLNVTVIMATHSPNQSFFFSNEQIRTKVAVLFEKTFSFYGEPKEVLTESTIEKVFNIHSNVLSYHIENKQYDFILPLSRRK